VEPVVPVLLPVVEAAELLPVEVPAELDVTELPVVDPPPSFAGLLLQATGMMLTTTATATDPHPRLVTRIG
jgi:hypothetical protein